MTANDVKVSFCVAYDWYLLEYSLRSIYDFADKICLSIDKDRISWSGKPFSFDEDGFINMVEKIDVNKKVFIYEEKFYMPELTPMQNEIRQRNMMTESYGEVEGWYVQLDADEYFLDFKGFVSFLKRFKSNRKVNICCPLLNLYKQIPQGMLWIKPNTFEQIHFAPIATRYPVYEHGRLNGFFNILTEFSILHQSWARDEAEIWEKLSNWGHSTDFDVEKYFLHWKKVNKDNYKRYINFHFLYPKTWPALELKQNVSVISDLLTLNDVDFHLPITQWQLRKANSIWLSRLNKLVNSILNSAKIK